MSVERVPRPRSPARVGGLQGLLPGTRSADAVVRRAFARYVQVEAGAGPRLDRGGPVAVRGRDADLVDPRRLVAAGDPLQRRLNGLQAQVIGVAVVAVGGRDPPRGRLRDG